MVRLILAACPPWPKAAIIANEHSSSLSSSRTLYSGTTLLSITSRWECVRHGQSPVVSTSDSLEIFRNLYVKNGSRHVSTATVNLAAALKGCSQMVFFLLHVLTPLLFLPAIQVSRALKVSLLRHLQLSLLHFKSLICAHKHISYIMVLSLNHCVRQLTGHVSVSMCVLACL